MPLSFLIFLVYQNGEKKREEGNYLYPLYGAGDI